MPCRQESKIIVDQNGEPHEYFVIQKPASQGEILKFKLITLLGPSISILPEMLSAKEDDTKAIELFTKALTALFDNTTPEAAFSFLQSLLIGVSRNGQRITPSNFDDYYSDNTLEFYKACLFVLEVNFSNFLKGLRSENMQGKGTPQIQARD